MRATGPQGRIGPVKGRSAKSASPSAHPVGKTPTEPPQSYRPPASDPEIIRPIPALTTLVSVCAAALCLPATSGASGPSGGAGMPTPVKIPTAQPANLTVSATANGMTIAAPESGALRSPLIVDGSLPAGDAGRTIELEMSGAKTDWTWQLATQTQVRGDGSYEASWAPARAGQYAVRAVVEQSGATAASGLPTITVTVYRPAVATLYGPGFYGRRTACGTILRKVTVGVANRTLPCGTKVALYYGGRMLVVPVIDRGPYANGANWDLTMVTGRALAITTTETIGAVPLPRTG